MNFNTEREIAKNKHEPDATIWPAVYFPASSSSHRNTYFDIDQECLDAA
jgi:hypothetical protein